MFPKFISPPHFPSKKIPMAHKAPNHTPPSVWVPQTKLPRSYSRLRMSSSSSQTSHTNDTASKAAEMHYLSSSIYGNLISICKKPALYDWSPGGNSGALYPHLSKPPPHMPLGGTGCTSAAEAVKSVKTWVLPLALPPNSHWVATDTQLYLSVLQFP